MEDVLLALALISVGVFVVTSMMIVYELSKRDVRINFFLLKLYIIKYIHEYKKITVKESGQVGPLYYPCVTSVNLALVFGVLGVLMN